LFVCAMWLCKQGSVLLSLGRMGSSEVGVQVLEYGALALALLSLVLSTVCPLILAGLMIRDKLRERNTTATTEVYNRLVRSFCCTRSR